VAGNKRRRDGKTHTLDAGLTWYHRALFWGAVAFVAYLALLLLFAWLGWPGELDQCTLPGGNCYCETTHSAGEAVIRQPSNTWSNVAAVLSGLLILAFADRVRAGRTEFDPRRNPMLSGGFYAVSYGAVVLFLGPGSMAFHASLTRFGGWLDTLSMILFITFVLLYDVARILGYHNRLVFAGAYIGVNVVLGLITWIVSGSGVAVFAAGVALAVCLEVAIALRGIGGVRRPLFPWLAAGLTVFAAALLIWRLSWTGAPLCDPHSPLQGHALWHVAAEGLVPFLLFRHFRGEHRRVG
jgi:hypothetical protein